MTVKKAILGISLLFAVSCQRAGFDTATQSSVPQKYVGTFQTESDAFLKEMHMEKERYIDSILESIYIKRDNKLQRLYHTGFMRYIQRQKKDNRSLLNKNNEELQEKFKLAFEKEFQKTREKVSKEYEVLGQRSVYVKTKFQQVWLRKLGKELQCTLSAGTGWRDLKAVAAITLNDPAYGVMNGKLYNKNFLPVFKGRNVLLSGRASYNSSSTLEKEEYIWMLSYCPPKEYVERNGRFECGEDDEKLVVFSSNSQFASFSFPRVGEYNLSLVVRDRIKGKCALVSKDIKVSSDSPFSPLATRFEPPLDKRALVKKYPQLHQISAVEAWDRSKKGEGITIAVIGTGVDYNNKYINQNILNSSCEKSGSGEYIVTGECEIPRNGVDDDENGYVDDTVGWNFTSNNAMPVDSDGHETWAASVAASPVFGVAPRAKILPITILGVGSQKKTNENSMSKAIRYAVDKKVNIISISVHAYLDNKNAREIENLAESIEYAQEKGVIIFSSVDNESIDVCLSEEEEKLSELMRKLKSKEEVLLALGSENMSADELKKNMDKLDAMDGKYRFLLYPMAFSKDYDNIFGVTGASPDGRLSADVMYGTPYVHFMAPVLVEALRLEENLPHAVNDTTELTWGASFATPIMAGVAALVWSTNPDLSIDELRDILMKSNIPQEELKGKVESLGLINACMAVEYAQGRDEAAMNDCPDHSDDREVWGELRYNVVKNWHYRAQ